MITPNPTSEKQNSPAAPDDKAHPNPANETSPEATGFFNRVQRELKPEPIHPSEAAEIVVDMEDD
jgi:hypothetical protein